MPDAGARRLYDLLDSLIALRLEFANDTEGETAVSSTLGLPKVREVRDVLDTAIEGMKAAIGDVERPSQRGRQRATRAARRR